MRTRALVIGLAVGGALASSCASTARDTLVDIYNDEASASDFAEACRIDAITFETATQAYTAQHGEPPSAESDLVPELIAESPDAWQFDPNAATSFTPLVGGRCDGTPVEPRVDTSIGQIAVDGITDSGDVACASDKRQIETALEAHFAVNGFDATTMDELLEFGVEDVTDRWTLDVPADASNGVPSVVPVAGGFCDV